MNFLANNFKKLREGLGLNQVQISIELGFNRSTWNNYETGKSKPNLDDFIKISKYFGTSASELLEMDLENVHLNKQSAILKNSENVHLNVHPNVHLTPQKQAKTTDIKITVDAQNEAKMVVIPITDISVAAGPGNYNQEYIENVETLRLPVQFLKKNNTYLCVKIKGASMAPTLQDGGYVVIRLLDKSEWAKMPDERIFVVVDMDGKSYLKRVKNRFKQDFIVLKSDSPDQVNFPAFNLATADINTIWYAEWYFSAKMPNIHDQYYSRLQRLEDKLDDLINTGKKINLK